MEASESREEKIVHPTIVSILVSGLCRLDEAADREKLIALWEEEEVISDELP
ncbi:hypothetical protein H5P28_04555 [Ruficoccus amylovorans]|uniref:Uncharacterized protein n=1 Tax=Ruficoccus amylovorans TaxID=1804625 RepID=A0A842HD61_9BACT|nr:hypothetical protein [Ruficoccus amylovorans]MBC2593527.1 hypothetical protein [Ruficoccus amylovorans]